MRIIYNSFIPFKGFVGINLFGVLFVRKEFRGNLPVDLIQHEQVHTEQMKRDGYLYFYCRYLYEYIRNLCKYKDSRTAYYNVSYEIEAYNNNKVNYE